MGAAGLRRDLIRPEWLFEVVSCIQAAAAPQEPSGAPLPVDSIFEVFPPQSDTERRLRDDLLARLKAEHVRSSAGPVEFPFAPSADASPESAPEPASIDAAVVRAEQLIQLDPATHWTVEVLARRVGLNRTDLEVGFREHCACTVHAYLVICRVAAAKVLLRKEPWRIGEVAKAVGWRSKVSLYTHFRAVLEMTPDKYRLRWTMVESSEGVRELVSRLCSH